MKKILSLLVLCLSFSGFSQSAFSKKAVVVDISGNFGYYNTIAQDSTGRVDGKTSTGKGLPYGLALGVEYGVLNILGIGIKGQSYKYASAPEDSNTVKARDISLVVNAHLIREKKFDLIFGGNIGYSGITFQSTGYQKTKFKGGGVAYDVHLTPKLYFGKHFGMFLSIAYAGVGYKKLNVSDKDRTYTDKISLKASGPNYTLGFQFKFGGE